MMNTKEENDQSVQDFLKQLEGLKDQKPNMLLDAESIKKLHGISVKELFHLMPPEYRFIVNVFVKEMLYIVIALYHYFYQQHMLSQDNEDHLWHPLWYLLALKHSFFEGKQWIPTLITHCLPSTAENKHKQQQSTSKLTTDICHQPFNSLQETLHNIKVG